MCILCLSDPTPAQIQSCITGKIIKCSLQITRFPQINGFYEHLQVLSIQGTFRSLPYNLPNLVKLLLKNCTEIQTIPTGLDKLETLQFQNCESLVNLPPLPALVRLLCYNTSLLGIGFLPCLRYANIRYVNTDRVFVIGDGLPELYELDLRYANIMYLPKSLGGGLRILNLIGCPRVLIPPTLNLLKFNTDEIYLPHPNWGGSLEYLSISSILIKFDDLGPFTNLRYLKLCYMDCETIPYLTELLGLEIICNNTLSYLPTCLEKVSNLELLDCPLCSSLPPNLYQVRKIILYNVSINTIPSSLTQLRELELYNTMVREIPTTLKLDSLKIKGRVPVSMCPIPRNNKMLNLPRKTYQSLFDNYLTLLMTGTNLTKELCTRIALSIIFPNLPQVMTSKLSKRISKILGRPGNLPGVLTVD